MAGRRAGYRAPPRESSLRRSGIAFQGEVGTVLLDSTETGQDHGAAWVPLRGLLHERPAERIKNKGPLRSSPQDRLSGTIAWGSALPGLKVSDSVILTV